MSASSGGRSGEGPVRVVLVDDHPIFRLGLTRAIASPSIAVIGEAGTGSGALDLVRRELPDVVLLDVALPDQDGFTVCRAIRQRWRSVGVILLTSFDDVASVRASRSAGARAHLSKETKPAAISEAIMSVAGDAEWSSFPTTGVDVLTARELDVLERLALGLTQREIASVLGLSNETVKSYLREAYSKLQVRDRAGALYEARSRGLIAATPGTGVPRQERDV
jgi:DNA-binding NarL/FixJ family response regulator